MTNMPIMAGKDIFTSKGSSGACASISRRFSIDFLHLSQMYCFMITRLFYKHYTMQAGSPLFIFRSETSLS